MLIKSVEFLFGENEHYIEKICQFIENRYLTLVCIFGNPNDIDKEKCEECLQSPKVNEQQVDWLTACEWGGGVAIGSTLIYFGIRSCYHNYHYHQHAQ